MKRSLWIAISLVLAAIIYLSFVRPHQMVSPGNLIPAHSALEGDCFACHAPLRGASAERCIACHAVADIGLRTTKGVKIVRPKARPAFHQALIEPDCMACHSDHTCYGCHEHQPAQILAKHREEGITNIDNCVRCHRNADADAGEGGGDREGDDD